MPDITTPHTLTLEMQHVYGSATTGFTTITWRVGCPYDGQDEKPCAAYLENFEESPRPPDDAGPEPTYNSSVGGWHWKDPDGRIRIVPDDDPWLQYYRACDEYQMWIPTTKCWVRDAVESGDGDWDWCDDLQLLPDLGVLSVTGPLLVRWENAGGFEESALRLTVIGMAG